MSQGAPEYQPPVLAEPPSYEAIPPLSETVLEVGDRVQVLQRENSELVVLSYHPPESSSTSSSPGLYTFGRLADNSMILIPPPPAAASDPQPVYHITVTQNLFNPFSYITTIRRGGTPEGQLVGHFEHGITDSWATVYIRGKADSMSKSLNKERMSGRTLWTWRRLEGEHFVWDTNLCYSRSNSRKLAKMYPLNPYHPEKPAQLEMFPDGNRYFDDILLSALIIERLRDLPSGTVMKISNLFSYAAS